MTDVSASLQPSQPNQRRSRPSNPGPQLDLADRLIALQRKAAGPPRQRTERTPTGDSQPALPAPPQPIASSSHPQQSQPPLRPPQPHPSLPLQSTTRLPNPSSSPPPIHRRRHRDPSPDDEYDRRMMLTMTRPPAQGKLYNPNMDPIPTRLNHREIDIDSDASSAGGGRPTRHRRPHASPTPAAQSQPRHLYDPRREDPIRFTVLTRGAGPSPQLPPSLPPKHLFPTPPLGGYVSASATSVSDAQSYASDLTLTSGTTSSSASNPYSPASGKELGGKARWLEQMKRMYRQIATLEGKILAEGDFVPEEEELESRNAHPHPQPALNANEEGRWARLVSEHKILADLCHHFMSFALKPEVPASLQTLPSKYNIPARMWNHGFQRLLAALRRASISSPSALEQLEALIIYAYGFYTSLVEEEHLAQFRVLWLEALGDLSRYQMAVVATPVTSRPGLQGGHLTLPAELSVGLVASPDVSRMEGDSPLPSVGAHAAAELEMEDDRELWRRNAREWYTKGIKDTPGQGRLHHHLGLVSLDAEGEELRAVYHFAKSLVANHACDIARESILPLFSLERQLARYQPESPAPSIFLLMHGMLFTKIQLDDFEPTVARFRERLTLYSGEVTESDWVMMASLNVAALLEYGRPEGVLRRICGWSSAGASTSVKASSRTPRVEVREPTLPAEGEDRMQVDSNATSTPRPPVVTVADPEEMRMLDVSATLSGPMEALSASASSIPEELPHTLKLALQLTFETLRHVLKNPFVGPKSRHVLNPYLTTIMTFLATVLKYEHALPLLERYVPWDILGPFFTSIHHRTFNSRTQTEVDDPSKIGKWFGTQPLPEDWCLRGSEWVRRVYERGFWRGSGKDGGITSEMDVLLPPLTVGGDEDGVLIESDNDGSLNGTSWTDGRFKRLRWAAEVVVRCGAGMRWEGAGKEAVAVLGPELSAKVGMWSEERRAEEESERRRRERVYVKSGEESMDVDGEDSASADEEEEEAGDSEEVKILKARRRYLRSLQNSKRPPMQTIPQRRPRRTVKPAKPTRPPLDTAPGYTILVCDTNILLSSLPNVAALISSQRWTVVIPLAVITELDGLSSSSVPELASAARTALDHLVSGIQTHSSSLKVQTSRGNYLNNLSIRAEDVDFADGERNLDDVIVRAAMWHLDHFVDRSALLTGAKSTVSPKTSKVVLLTFDRNMRLKARSRKLDAADEKDMATIFRSP